jgi:exopolyphosphatase / guanosine-5'-triphosphate,3'-diphosphate pyrophosphatase
MKRARTAAQLEFEPITARFRRSEWDSAFGASGTMRAVSDVLLARGAPNGDITRDGVEWMVEECLRAGSVGKLKLPGVTADRQEILPGGLAIMVEAFEMLDIESLRVADGALREGLLYDLLGRMTDEDARVRSVRAMEGRFHVDTAQADRVEASALGFLRQVREAWGLEEPLAELMLRWASRLHEIGLDIAHAHYHRHGAYLLEHADMPGFPREEQRLLSVLVGGHRRRLTIEPRESLVPPWHVKSEFMVVLLRLAVLLNRGRGPKSLPRIDLEARGRSLVVGFPKGWLAEHPLTAADLEQEVEYLRDAGFRLRTS